MHELSITESVVQTVSDRMGEAQVIRVCLEIGKLSGVVADSVKFCFELVTDGTTLAGASLEVIETPGRGRCRACGSEVELFNLLDMCTCGSTELDVLSGEQLRIKEVEVAA
jgi:hydrogenase nickel incorporation protein HypA/HybF